MSSSHEIATTNTKAVIGVDVDDVLTPLISHLLEFYNKKHNAQIQFEDFRSFRYHEVNIYQCFQNKHIWNTESHNNASCRFGE